MLRQRLVERRRFLAWEGHLHRPEDSPRPYLEEETGQEATAILEETVEWLRRLSWVDYSLAACRS
jgi:hypothetical protein